MRRISKALLCGGARKGCIVKTRLGFLGPIDCVYVEVIVLFRPEARSPESE